MKKFLIIAAIAGAALAGCDAIKEAVSTEFTANNVMFDFAVVVNEVAIENGEMSLMSSGIMNSFSETRTVNISEIGSAEVAEYASKISKVVVNSSLLEVTTNPPGNYTVENLTISTASVSGSLVIPSYTVGTTFTPPSNMNIYMAAFILKLINSNSLTVTVTGQTDAPAGTTVNISYNNTVVFTASLL